MSKYFLFALIMVSKLAFAEEELNKVFANWTDHFNHRQLKASCELFSMDVIAHYQGFPQKNYQTICAGFKKIFSEKDFRYFYDYKIHHLYKENNLAAVQITWFLHIYKNNKLQQYTQDEGLDILQRDKRGQWKIINYLAFPTENQYFRK